ncbi:MAG TPA: hypothetical protein VG406_29155 [Isosphaeraceae bacterium]|nr:hypothetical protein [Isosphaeraceae bacterium]
MALDTEQRVAMQLAGTVPIPSPTPAVGSVTIVAPLDAGGKPGEDLFLRVDHRVNKKLVVRRHVRVADVRLVQAPRGLFDGTPMMRGSLAPDPRHGEWESRATAEVAALALEKVAKQAASNGNGHHNGELAVAWLSHAIVHVPEAAPVLLNVEAGMTAAEAAEYYPPVGVAGCAPRPYEERPC